MGWVSVAVIIFIIVVCSYIIFDSSQFSNAAVTLASGGLLVDVLATMLAIWKLVMGKGPQQLTPYDTSQESNDQNLWMVFGLVR
jgi:hypothetical protein